jgi:hypothetical protein
MSAFTESVVEEATLEWFEALGYPPDKQEVATKRVLQQAELLSEAWVGAVA